MLDRAHEHRQGQYRLVRGFGQEEGRATHYDSAQTKKLAVTLPDHEGYQRRPSSADWSSSVVAARSGLWVPNTQ
jgi:hypothetical protein